VFGKRALKKRFDIFLSAITSVRDRSDAETIHYLRVASRRFHAAAMLFGESVSRTVLTDCEKRIRRIRKSAGAVRDGDVQSSMVYAVLKKRIQRRFHPGLERLLLRHSQQREKRMRRVLTALDAFDKNNDARKMKQALIARPPARTVVRSLPLRRRAAREISMRLEQLKNYEQFVLQPTAAAELHALRIEAKRLRYVMEIFAPLYNGKLKPFIRTVRSLQEALGRMHDCDVWAETLPLFLERERLRTAKYFGDSSSFYRIERGIVFFADYVRTVRLKQYRAFVRIWMLATRRSLWKRLIDTIT
jgi:CHAD domain-containing protein